MLRKNLGFAVAEVDAMPWWQHRMYIEQMNEDNERESQESGSGSAGSDEAPGRWTTVGDDNLASEGFAVRSVPAA